MTFETKFNIGDRVRILGTERSFEVGKIRTQTIPLGKFEEHRKHHLVLVEYCAIWQSGRQGVFSPESRLVKISKA